MLFSRSGYGATVLLICYLVQDELSTTKDNYESQISVMSDHICSLNETITKQRDEMELLKSTKVRMQ